MDKLLLVGLGGFTGALLRYGVSGFVETFSRTGSFPLGTLAVNFLGCILIGFLSQMAETFDLLNGEFRSFLFIGLLGSFTTFSTFGHETVSLMRDGEGFLSLANIRLHLLLGLAGVWLGRVILASLVR